MLLLYSPLLLIFLFLTLTFVFVTCGRAHWHQTLSFCRYLKCCYDAVCSRQTPVGGLKYFSFVKSCIHFPITQFLPVLFTFALETKTKAKRAWSMLEVVWWFCLLGWGNMTFHWLRCLQLLGEELFILITSLVFFHHVHVWLDWYGLCVRVCVCSIEVSTGKHNSVNYYRITSIFIAFFCLEEEF